MSLLQEQWNKKSRTNETNARCLQASTNTAVRANRFTEPNSRPSQTNKCLSNERRTKTLVKTAAAFVQRKARSTGKHMQTTYTQMRGISAGRVTYLHAKWNPEIPAALPSGSPHGCAGQISTITWPFVVTLQAFNSNGHPIRAVGGPN